MGTAVNVLGANTDQIDQTEQSSHTSDFVSNSSQFKVVTQPFFPPKV